MTHTKPLTPVGGIGLAEPAPSTQATEDGAPVVPKYPASTGRVLLLVVTAMLVLTQLYAAIPLAGPIGDDLGATSPVALSTVYGLCYAAGFLFWGPIADLYGNKRIMVIGLGALTALTIACAFATSVPMLAVVRGLQGFAAASFPPAALAYLAVATTPRFRTTAIGAVSTSFLVSGILGQLFASTISQRLSLAAIARTGVVVGAVGLLVEALLASTLPGTAAASLAFVAGISLAVSAMISLFGEAAARTERAEWPSTGSSCSSGRASAPSPPLWA